MPLLLAAALGCAACNGSERSSPQPSAAGEAPATNDAGPAPTAPEGAAAARPAAPAPPAPAREAPRVVFLGDSLTAGLGLAEEQAFPARLERLLGERGRPIDAVNAGVSGDTTAGGLRRVPWLLRQEPDLLVVELGANDALRGQPIAGVEANLRAIVEQARAAGVPVLLVGMRIPPSYGGEYATAFTELYPRLAAALEVPLVPFLLEGVAADPALNLPDGIHPNARGHQRLAEAMAPYVEAALADGAPQ